MQDVNLLISYQLLRPGRFSDVTIKFGDDEVKCHKIILCATSEYFRALCGPDCQFAEANQRVIELKDDPDPDVIRGLLQYMYTWD